MTENIVRYNDLAPYEKRILWDIIGRMEGLDKGARVEGEPENFYSLTQVAAAMCVLICRLREGPEVVRSL